MHRFIPAYPFVYLCVIIHMPLFMYILVYTRTYTFMVVLRVHACVNQCVLLCTAFSFFYSGGLSSSLALLAQFYGLLASQGKYTLSDVCMS